MPFSLYLLISLCGSRENVPLRSLASGNIINLWSQLLCAEIRYCICSESTYPVAARSEMLSTPANGWGLLRHQDCSDTPGWGGTLLVEMTLDPVSGRVKSSHDNEQFLSLLKWLTSGGIKKNAAGFLLKLEAPDLMQSGWFQPCKARQG